MTAQWGLGDRVTVPGELPEDQASGRIFYIGPNRDWVAIALDQPYGMVVWRTAEAISVAR